MRLGAVAFVSLFLFLMLAGMLFVGFSFANFLPEQAPAGIVIKSDGSVEGTDLIRWENGVYVFTGDIHRTIVVLRDGIVVDGVGHCLQGGGRGFGFFLQGRSDVEIRNVTISNFEIGIKFTWLSYDARAVLTRNIVSGNTIVNNTYGIGFFDPNSCVVLRDNQFVENKYGVFDNVARSNDVDASNTVNGKPIYYWVDQHDRTVPSDAGFVVLKNCSGITVRNLDLQGNVQGVLLYYTTGSTVDGNFLANNIDGITLKESSNNTISVNHVTNNKEYGVHLDLNSASNLISDNTVESNGKDGIYDGYYSHGTMPGNMISQNQITNNHGNGVTLYNQQDSKVVGNNVTLNSGCGIRLAYGTTNITVKGNFIAKNGIGIQIESPVQTFVATDTVVNGAVVKTTPNTIIPKGSTITENTVTENNGWGIRLNSSEGGNVIHHNSFINNHVADGLQVSIPAVWIFDPPGSQKDGPTLAPGNANVWDDGKEGNYWSDYTSRYPNASEVGNTGVGDTPFYINENNIDGYPLLSPVEISEGTLPANPPSFMPSLEPESTETSGTQKALEPLPILVVATAFAASTAAVVGLIVIFKKRNRQVKQL